MSSVPSVLIIRFHRSFNGCQHLSAFLLGLPLRLGALPDLSQLLDLSINAITNTTPLSGPSSSHLAGPGQQGSLSIVTPSPHGARLATSLSPQNTAVTGPSLEVSRVMDRTNYILPTIQGIPSTEDTTPSLVSIHTSLPLLPRKLVQQINVGEFVDLADLPPTRRRQSGSFPTVMLSTLRLLQLQDMECRQRLIPDFLTWSQCFAVYAAVLGSSQPHWISELMS